MTDLMAWSGTCRECVTQVIVAAHDESMTEVIERVAGGPDAWDAFSDCLVCGGTIDWNGSDPLPLTVR